MSAPSLCLSWWFVVRVLAEPFVVAAPTGTSTSTSVFTTESEHAVLVESGSHLGRLMNQDLAARCALGAGPKHMQRAERKQALTGECSSRWAGTITRRSADMWERQKLNYIDEHTSKQAAIAAITTRLKKPVGGKGGYATKRELFAKQQRLQILQRRVGWLEDRLKTGRMSMVRGGRKLLNNRNNLEAAGLTEPRWRDGWDAARWFITADGDRGYRWGNGLIAVNADTGVVAVTLPAPLRHLANAPRGRFVLATPVTFKQRGDEWAAQAETGSVAYDLTYDADRRRWYLAAAWKIPAVELPSLYQLRRLNTLAVDLNAGHLAAWVITSDGNPLGDPITIPYDTCGTAGHNNASLRHAITKLLNIAVNYRCGSISSENLNFVDARASGRETMGRDKRGKQFRQTVASIPTAAFRDLLTSMAYNAAIAVIAVDPAYTSKWGREHWLAPLNNSRRTPCNGHHAAAVVIGRRALGLTAKRCCISSDGTTGIRQRTERRTAVRRGWSRTSEHSRSRQAQDATTPRKRGNTSSAQPRTVRDSRNTQGQQPSSKHGVVETRTRKPVTLQRQDTATVQGVRVASSESQPLPKN